MQRTLVSTWKSAVFNGCCLLLAMGGPTVQAQQSDSYDQQRQSGQQNSSQPSYQGQGQSQGQRQSDSQSRDQFGQQNDQSSQPQQNDSQQNSQFGEQRNPFDQNRNWNQQSTFANQNQRQQDQPAGLGVSISESSQQGVTVEQVHQGSPAQQAGIREGDRILRISGRQIRSVPDLMSTIQNMDPGQKVQIEVFRDGREQTLTATLETRREALMPEGEAQFAGWSHQPFPQTPWEADQIAEHIQSLEQEIRYLTQEVQSLRSMIASDPDQFRGSQQSGSLQNQRMSQRSANERSFDGLDRQNSQFDSSQRFQGQGAQPQDSQQQYSPQGNRN